MRSPHVLLAQPLNSSALFNAVNSAVSKRADGREYMLQFTETDVLRAQWLVGVRVLVVDDSALNREVAQGILQSQGAIVDTCSDGGKAVEHVRIHHQHLDVVLMDVQMPVLDGNAATQVIRGELKLHNLPIIALTAGALANERQRALRAGMNDVVTKPFDPQVLIRKIRYVVENSRSEPIPVNIFDRNRVDRPAHAPLIASINAGVVQQMFGENTRLFNSALSRILRDYAEFAVSPRATLDDPGARSQLKARVHELKGSAGLIGATGIMRLANSAETALEQERSNDVVVPILEQLAAAFLAMRDEARVWLAAEAERENQSEKTAMPGPNIDVADIDEMHELLDTRNLAVLDKFSQLSPSFCEVLGMERFECLREAVDNLEFARAAQLLREYCSTITPLGSIL
jgi:CheY-like chemotaxis protein/HPt (histidine-containing phosphotransfer) domain-containing protein